MPTPPDTRRDLACPACRERLDVAASSLACSGCGAAYPVRHGIPRLLTPADGERVARFLGGYQRVRAAEGWGSDDPAWLRALPAVPSTDPHREIWRIREVSLTEGLRVLRPGGRAIVLDSPIYRDPASGRAMVAERAVDLQARFGIAPAPGDPVGCLTWAGLDAAVRTLRLRWSVTRPWYGVQWAVRPWRARLRGRREPATFAILVGRLEAPVSRP